MGYLLYSEYVTMVVIVSTIIIWLIIVTCNTEHENSLANSYSNKGHLPVAGTHPA